MAAGVVLAIGVVVLPSIASAQQYPPPVITTTPSVRPNEVTTTTTPGATTTSQPPGTTSTQPEGTTSTSVAGDEVTRTTTGPLVAGAVVSRPLPRTGGDLDRTALFGGALTVVGILLAVGARRRRTLRGA